MKITEMTQEQKRQAIKENEKRREAVIARCGTEEIKEFFLTLPKTYKNLFYDVLVGKTTNFRAVKAKCLDCCCFQKDEITNCEIKTCPLWRVRPYQSK